MYLTETLTLHPLFLLAHMMLTRMMRSVEWTAGLGVGSDPPFLLHST